MMVRLSLALLALLTRSVSGDVQDLNDFVANSSAEDPGHGLPLRESNWTVIAGTPVSTAGEAFTWDDSAEGRRDWMIQFPDSWSTEQLEECAEIPMPGFSSMTWKGHPSEGGVSCSVFHGNQWELAAFLEDNPGAVFVEEDVNMVSVSHGDGSEAGRRLAAQELNAAIWGLDRVDSRAGLDQIYDSEALTGRGVHVYVMDTGIRTTHEDFEGRAIPTAEILGNGIVECEADDTTCAADVNGHGTHCAGTIGGKRFGIAKESTLHAMKVLGDDGSGSFSFFIMAIDFVATRGQRPAVISASLGGRGTLRTVNSAINRATSLGVTVVVAAGNEGNTAVPDACSYTPAGVPAAITVGSIGEPRFNDQRSGFSNIGECVDIFAPGGLIPSCSADSDTGAVFLSGTSMACPHVAGAAALILEQDPRRTPQDVNTLLKSTATEGAIDDVGSGSANRLLFVGGFGDPVAVGTTTTAAPQPPRAAPDGLFQEISAGTCLDAGLSPITLVATCESAAQALGLADTTVELTDAVSVLEGCFVSGDGRLRLGTNPATRGVAAFDGQRALCTSMTPHYEEVTSGNCASAGLSPLALAMACVDARQALGIGGVVRLTEISGTPEACFTFRGTSVFFDILPSNKGNGIVFTSDGSPLTPVCMSFVTNTPTSTTATTTPPPTATTTTASRTTTTTAASTTTTTESATTATTSPASTTAPVSTTPTPASTTAATATTTTTTTSTITITTSTSTITLTTTTFSSTTTTSTASTTKTTSTTTTTAITTTASTTAATSTSASTTATTATTLPPGPTLPAELSTLPPTTTFAAGTTAALSTFREIRSGTCEDAGFFSISTVPTCEAAARALGIRDRTARRTGRRQAPEGCFYFIRFNERRNRLRIRLLVGVNKRNRGKPATDRRRALCSTVAPQYCLAASTKTNETCEKAGPGLETINFETACNDAREQLGLSGTIQTRGESATAACYLASSAGDSKQAVRFDTDAKSAVGSFTHICAAYYAPVVTTPTLRGGPTRTSPEEEPVSGAQSLWSRTGLAATILAVALAMSQVWCKC
mmetsp:Transcript_35183/g.73909  ORF Transcript_35183/g.73909 Transcript_35183/m.73909 type:complete len:1054 (+) Transcript_35183:64-3225(+)